MSLLLPRQQLITGAAAARLMSGTAPPPPPPSFDPNFANVAFLSGFNGANDARPTDLDESDAALVNSWAGSAAQSSLDTSVVKFGSASYKQLSSGNESDYAFILNAAATDLIPASPNGDYTWECFFYVNGFASTGQNDLWGWWRSTGTRRGYIWGFENDRFELIWSSTGSNAFTETWLTTIATGQWYHFAAVKTGLNVEVFLDGVSLGTNTLSADIRTPDTVDFFFGGHDNNSGSGSNGLQGYLDEVRFTKGVARYSANFTVPTAEYPRVGEINVALTIANSGFETGNFTSWTATRGSMQVVTSVNGLTAQAGTWYAMGATIAVTGDWEFRTQIIPTTGVPNNAIDAGLAKVVLRWWQANAFDLDDGSMFIEMLDGSNNPVSPVLQAPIVEITPITTWEERTLELALAPGTRNIRIYVAARLVSGSQANSSFDTISMTALNNDLVADTRTSATIVIGSTTQSPPSNINESLGTNPSIANLVDQDAATTGWTFGLTGPNLFNGPNNGGAMAYNPLTLSELWSRGRASSTPGADVTMRIGGLNPANTYDVEIFGSRDSSGNRNTDFTIGSTTQRVNAQFNIESLTFAGESPDGSGNIDILMQTALGSAFSYVTTIKITEN